MQLAPWLLLTAAPAEAEAVARGLGDRPAPDTDWRVVDVCPGLALARTGVGKVNAAVAAAKLADPARFSAVINLGIAGALPSRESGRAPLAIGQVVVADACVYADEGVGTGDGFITLEQLGFPIRGASSADAAECFDGDRLIPDPDLTGRCARAIGASLPCVRGTIATVSCCSGADHLAASVAERTGAVVEAMEGAAIAHALARVHGRAMPFCEVRVVSNTTGDRQRQVWDIRSALATLSGVAAALREVRSAG